MAYWMTFEIYVNGGDSRLFIEKDWSGDILPVIRDDLLGKRLLKHRPRTGVHVIDDFKLCNLYSLESVRRLVGRRMYPWDLLWSNAQERMWEILQTMEGYADLEPVLKCVITYNSF